MNLRVGMTAIAVVFMAFTTAYAAPPATIAIHGSLTAPDGSPLTGDRAYSVTFHDASTGGNSLGSALTGTVTLTDKGLFNIAVTPPDEIFSAAQVWYELAIDSDGGGLDTNDVFAARTQVQSVPFAKNVGLPERSTAHVVVQTTDNAVTNGANLLAAYAAAKALTPGGAALSASNRAVVLVSPGPYDLGTGSLTLDTEFVDLVGLSTARDDQYLYGTSNGAGTGVLAQTADNVRIENLLVHCTSASGGLSHNATDPAAYFPNGALADTIVRNCEFRANDVNAWSMRIAIEYKGTYERCTGGMQAFGGSGTASGTFTNCTGESNAFGGSGTASGTFTHCTGGGNAFGFGVSASGTFTNCTGANGAFGGYGTASGTFTNCTGADGAFGGNGTASGTFTNCAAGYEAFGSGVSATASGKFTHCTGGNYAFGTGPGSTAGGGRFYHCVGGSGAFTETGSPAPVHLFCIQNGAQYSEND